MNLPSILEGNQQENSQKLKNYRRLRSPKEILTATEIDDEWLKIINCFHKAGFTGRGQKIAIIDTGYDSDNKIIQAQVEKDECIDFTGEGINDLNGHGTLVSLLILACAPDARLLHLKIFNKKGSVDPEKPEYLFAEAIKRADQANCTAINISAGMRRTVTEFGSFMTDTGCCICPICKAANEVSLHRDTPVFAAVGNQGSPTREWNCPSSTMGVVPVIGLINGLPIYESVTTTDHAVGAVGIVPRPPILWGDNWLRLTKSLITSLIWTTSKGSSFATPLVCGTGALVLEYFGLYRREGDYPPLPNGEVTTIFQTNGYEMYRFALKDYFKNHGHDSQPKRIRGMTSYYTLSNIARLVFEHEDYDSAILAYKLLLNLLDLNPEQEAYWYIQAMTSLGVSYLRFGNNFEASRIFAKAKEICLANLEDKRCAESREMVESNLKLAQRMYEDEIKQMADYLNASRIN